MSTLALRNNTGQHRYEAVQEEKVAGYAEYNLLPDAVMLIHTEVLPDHEGQGVGSFLAREALQDARHQGRFVIPACPFIASYLRKHREWLDVVQPEVQEAYKL